jgi:group I intron endonuclease
MNIIEIYGIVNRVNGKIYIGQTKQGYLKRFKQHLCPKDKSVLLQNAIKKYGRNNFVCELLDVAYSQDLADAKEKMWIYLLQTFKHENGYNLSMGGKIGQFNEETLAKMSASKIGAKNSFFGKHHTDETRKTISELHKNNGGKLGNHNMAKKVRCIETGVVYSCVLEASKETGANSKHIGGVANGRYGRKTAGGFTWEWA